MIVVKPLQFSNAELPMAVTVDGKVTEVIPVASIKAYLISVTPSGMTSEPVKTSTSLMYRLWL